MLLPTCIKHYLTISKPEIKYPNLDENNFPAINSPAGISSIGSGKKVSASEIQDLVQKLLSINQVYCFNPPPKVPYFSSKICQAPATPHRVVPTRTSLARSMGTSGHQSPNLCVATLLAAQKRNRAFPTAQRQCCSCHGPGTHTHVPCHPQPRRNVSCL